MTSPVLRSSKPPVSEYTQKEPDADRSQFATHGIGSVSTEKKMPILENTGTEDCINFKNIKRFRPRKLSDTSPATTRKRSKNSEPNIYQTALKSAHALKRFMEILEKIHLTFGDRNPTSHFNIINSKIKSILESSNNDKFNKLRDALEIQMLGDTALSLINDHISSSSKKEMQKLFTLINFIDDMEYEHICDLCQLSEQSINHPSKEVIVLLNTALFKKQLSRFIIEKEEGLFRTSDVKTTLTSMKNHFDEQFFFSTCVTTKKSSI